MEQYLIQQGDGTMSKRGLKFKRDKRAKRKENNIILIICGGMTEVLYFKALNIELGEM